MFFQRNQGTCLLLMLGMVNSFQAFDITRPGAARATTTTIPQFYKTSEVEGLGESPSFRQRMLNRLQKNKKNDSATKLSKNNPILTTVRTIDEFKKEVVDGASGLVVVWYYAPWCRACKQVAPGFVSLTRRHPNAKFVQVPALEENKALHQGLGVPSVPYVQLYHPEGGLIEEQKLKRPMLSGFHKKLQDYEQGSCSLERFETWSPFSPYDPVPTEH
eukprot:scaffold11900_cov90-Cylindrotheca_fusiformis.AAC.4